MCQKGWRDTNESQKIGLKNHWGTSFKSAKNLGSKNWFLKSEVLILNRALTQKFMKHLSFFITKITAINTFMVSRGKRLALFGKSSIKKIITLSFWLFKCKEKFRQMLNLTFAKEFDIWIFL